MRIVSLLPSATEIVCALGLRDELFGVSHCCDHPLEIEGIPVVTKPLRRRAARPGQVVDDEIGPAELDVETFLAARPELVILRDDIPGGIGSREVRAARPKDSEGSEEPAIVSLDAVSVEGVFHSIATIGAMAEAEDEAIELLEVLREDLSDLERQAATRREQGVTPPRVAVLQSIDPPFVSGRWVPEQVRRAGGWDVLGREGEAPAQVDWDAIRDVDPEMLILAPSGMHLPAAKRAFARMEKPAVWQDLAAVRRGRVFVVEPVYFDRPGPRLVDGVGLLAEILDPDGFEETSPPGSWIAASE